MSRYKNHYYSIASQNVRIASHPVNKIVNIKITISSRGQVVEINTRVASHYGSWYISGSYCFAK